MYHPKRVQAKVASCLFLLPLPLLFILKIFDLTATERYLIHTLYITGPPPAIFFFSLVGQLSSTLIKYELSSETTEIK